jgi:PAS domain S-box-containing protein
MKIRTKLLVGFLSISLLTASAGFWGMYQLRKITVPLEKNVPLSIKQLYSNQEIERTMARIRYLDEALTQSIRNYILTGNVQWKQRYNVFKPEMDNALRQVTGISGDDLKPLFKRIEAVENSRAKVERRAMALVDNNRQRKAMTLLESTEYWEKQSSVESGVQDFFLRHGAGEKYEVAVLLAVQHANKELRNGMMLTFYFIMLLTCISLILSFLITRSISRPLRQLLLHTEKVGSGDLSQYSGVISNDEIGIFASSFNKMIGNVKAATDDYKSAKNIAEEAYAESKRSQESLRLSEERFRGAFETAAIGMALIGLAGRFLKVNRSLCDMVGYSEEELLTRTYQDITHPDDQENDLASTKRLMSGESAYCHIEKRYIHRAGDIVWILMSASMVTDNHGAPQYFVVQIENITERKQAEDGIRKEKAFSEAMLDSLPGIFYVFDRTGRFLRWNHAFETISGYSWEEIAAMGPLDYFAGDDRALLEKSIGKVFETGAVDVEAAFLSKDGRRTPYYFVGVRFVRDGVPLCIGMGIDITKRKQADEALSARNRDLTYLSTVAVELASTQSDDRMFSFALSKLKEISGAALAIFGVYDPLAHDIHVRSELIDGDIEEEFIKAFGGKKLAATRFPVSDELRIELINNAISFVPTLSQITMGVVPEEIGRRAQAAMGIDRFIGIAYIVDNELYGTSVLGLRTGVPDPPNDIVKLLANMTAVSLKRKRAEEALQESERQLSLVYNTVGDSIFYLAVEKNELYRFISVNKAFVKTTGIDYGHIIGKLVNDVIPAHSLDTVLEKYQKAIRDKNSVQWEETSDYPTGKLTGEVRIVPVFDNAGNCTNLIGAVHNITERKHLEAQLRHAQKMEAVGTLAGGIAHDFNNILNVIIGYGTMVMDKMEAESPTKEQMHEVLAAADRAAELTKRLLLFSRKEVAEMKPADVNDIVRNMEKMLSRIVREDIRLATDLMGTKVMIMADVGQIEQVLMNLASNARDAMSKGGSLTLKTELREIDTEFIKAYEYGLPGKYAVISVIDTGTGIDKEKQDRIFDPFFTTKEVGMGTGLGLAIAYGIIKQHNGYIKVYSEPDKGTTFKIWLPVIEEEAAKKLEVEAAVQQQGGTETILVAEDDASLRKLSRIVLESYGYSVITAEDGEDAITKFMENKGKISLALIDMIMPKKNGKEVGEAIRKVSPDTKILFASGYTMDIINTRELTEAGFDFILKPVVPRDLLKKVREILDRKT